MESTDNNQRLFKITRFERRGYYTFVPASSASEAMQIFNANGCLTDGIILQAHEEDSIECEEINPQ